MGAFLSHMQVRLLWQLVDVILRGCIFAYGATGLGCMFLWFVTDGLRSSSSVQQAAIVH